MGNHSEEYVGLLGLALQSNSCNSLVLIPHRQLGNFLLNAGESYGPAAQHKCKILYRSMFDTYQQDYYSGQLVEQNPGDDW